ncbi:MAG: urease accessory protein UreF [Magnetococcales bacterium]|nr:urease accessory protein UreF [Magnetococcales bacterium]
MTTPDGVLLSLLSWFSPGFPVGAFTCSHGLEQAVEAGLVRDADSLGEWIAGILGHGAGFNDGLLFLAAHEAACREDWPALDLVTHWADALRATGELALESSTQGQAFLVAVRQGWPHPWLDAWAGRLPRLQRTASYAVATGLACAAHGVPLEHGLTAFLHAFCVNLISAGVRSVPLGQRAGVTLQAGLQPLLAATVQRILQDRQQPFQERLGACVPMVDWCSFRHETQYTRLYRT